MVGPPLQWPPSLPLPVPEDTDGWQKMIDEQDQGMLELVGDALTAIAGSIEDIHVGTCPVYVITPDGVTPDDQRVYLDIHGGAWTIGGGQMCRLVSAASAAAVGARTWTVDYRMPPAHAFPAALDDCLAAYRALLEQRRPDDIIIGGTSAGGNLSAALILRARDEGLPLPAAAVLITPVTDLTAAGDTLQVNLGLDILLTAAPTPAALLYAADHDLRHPYLSPLFGDLGKGFPPTILLSGTRDLLLSDTVRMHRALRAAGVPAELHVFEAAGHGMFLGQAPEDRERAREIRRFADEHWSHRSQP
jgi:acetyl esterase/lipase